MITYNTKQWQGYTPYSTNPLKFSKTTQNNVLPMINVTNITSEYPDVDLLTIADGRVIGISSDCVVLYANMDAYYACDHSDNPSITL